jgi:hypothetical protein
LPEHPLDRAPLAVHPPVGQVQVLHVQGQQLVGAGGTLLQQPPQGSLPQLDPTGKHPLELAAGEGPGAVDPLPASLQGIGRIDGEPAAAAPPANRGPQGGELPVPGRRRRRGVAAAKPASQHRARQLADRGRRAEASDQVGERGPIDPPGGPSEILVIQEGFGGVLERSNAAGRSNDLPTRTLSWLSQQTGAARASHPAATVQAQPSSTSWCPQQIGALLRQHRDRWIHGRAGA